jgi:hypothetical protein
MTTTTTTVKHFLEITSKFLSVFIHNPASPVPPFQRLQNTIPAEWPPPANVSQQTLVLLYSLDLLSSLAAAVHDQNYHLGIKDWRQLTALVEFIIVVGEYKSLSAGAGVSSGRTVTSVVLTPWIEGWELSLEERVQVLERFVGVFKGIVDRGGEVGDMFRKKFLVDIITGMTELAYNPVLPEETRAHWLVEYQDHLKWYSLFDPSNLSLPLSSILATHTALLHPSTPDYLRPHLTHRLSSIPLDSPHHGLRTTIQFLLGKQPTIQQLERISRIVGSIPTWISAEVDSVGGLG